MGKLMKAKCLKTCFDSAKGIRFDRNVEYDIDINHPCAIHFELPAIERKKVLELEQARMEETLKKQEAMRKQNKNPFAVDMNEIKREITVLEEVIATT